MQKVTLCIKIPIEFELTLDVFPNAKTEFKAITFLYKNWQNIDISILYLTFFDIVKSLKESKSKITKFILNLITLAYIYSLYSLYVFQLELNTYFEYL